MKIIDNELIKVTTICEEVFFYASAYLLGDSVYFQGIKLSCERDRFKKSNIESHHFLPVSKIYKLENRKLTRNEVIGGISDPFYCHSDSEETKR